VLFDTCLYCKIVLFPLSGSQVKCDYLHSFINLQAKGPLSLKWHQCNFSKAFFLGTFRPFQMIGIRHSLLNIIKQRFNSSSEVKRLHLYDKHETFPKSIIRYLTDFFVERKTF
jgi:hypothetical protein